MVGGNQDVEMTGEDYGVNMSPEEHQAFLEEKARLKNLLFTLKQQSTQKTETHVSPNVYNTGDEDMKKS